MKESKRKRDLESDSNYPIQYLTVIVTHKVKIAMMGTNNAENIQKNPFYKVKFIKTR